MKPIETLLSVLEHIDEFESRPIGDGALVFPDDTLDGPPRRPGPTELRASQPAELVGSRTGSQIFPIDYRSDTTAPTTHLWRQR